MKFSGESLKLLPPNIRLYMYHTEPFFDLGTHRNSDTRYLDGMSCHCQA